MGSGLRAFKARLPPGSLGDGCGFRSVRFASARFRMRGWKPRLPAEDFACFASARSWGAVGNRVYRWEILRALRARVLQGSHGI